MSLSDGGRSLLGGRVTTARHGLLTGVPALPGVHAVGAHAMRAGADAT
jgi:hypothetical protein